MLLKRKLKEPLGEKQELSNDINWHTEKPESFGTILVLDDCGYYSIYTWCEFQDLKHPAGWYENFEPICGEIIKWARIK